MYTDEELREASRVTPMQIATSPIVIMLVAKTIILIALGRWARSMSK